MIPHFVSSVAPATRRRERFAGGGEKGNDARMFISRAKFERSGSLMGAGFICGPLQPTVGQSSLRADAGLLFWQSLS
jgi:hypothetical protein